MRRSARRRRRAFIQRLIAVLLVAAMPIAGMAFSLAAGDMQPSRRSLLLVAAALAGALLFAWILIGRLVAQPLTELVAGMAAANAEEAQAARREIAEALLVQQRLTREVHHRVKNNLQIVASLISVQAREAESGGAARGYAGIQMRVGALALVHRWLFEDVEGRGVDLTSLAHDLCTGLPQSIAAIERVEPVITTRFERIYVSQDAAVPLAFLITELAAAAGRGSASGGDNLRPAIAFEIARRAESGQLRVTTDVFKGADELSPTSATAAARIVNGMVRQLRGKLTHDAGNGIYVVEFPLATIF